MANKTLWENTSAFPLNKTFLSRILALTVDRILAWVSVSSIKILGSKKFPMYGGDEVFWFDTDVVLDWSNIDTGSEETSTWYYVYICDDGSDTPVYKISKSATAPNGYTAGTSTQIGKFYNDASGDINADSVIDIIDIYEQTRTIGRSPVHYERDQKWMKKSGDNDVLQSPNKLSVNIGNKGYALLAQTELDLSLEATWDTITPTDYTVAATRAGKDFYVYACQPGSGTVPVFKVSANSTVPSGYTADNSRKVAGIHCLCINVGTIAGHTLTGYLQGDILPASVWDLQHRPVASPEGMVYSEALNKWVDIYLTSGIGSNTASVYGATISDSRNWMDFVDDGHAVLKRLPHDHEFQAIAAGSNEETNISGSADPGTTGGHSDTAARRMISNIGCEDCCGAMWQWLLDQSWRCDGADLAAVQTWAWQDLADAKGSLYKQGTYGDVKLLAGGNWTYAATCGSRCRHAINYRWHTGSSVGARLLSEPLKTTLS